MKRLILIIAIMASSYALFSQDTAYLVSFDSAGVIVPKIIFKIDSVQCVLNRKFSEFKKDGLYFNFYIERKRVNNRGKLRRIKTNQNDNNKKHRSH